MIRRYAISDKFFLGMCGIAVLIGGPVPLETPYIHEMLSSIVHRGPDDEGYLAVDSAGSVRAWGGVATPPGVFRCPFPIPVDTAVPPGPMQVLAGSRRLAIVDLKERAHQPMSCNAGRYVIVFNGEIYNFRSLQRELTELGARFSTDCDSEVLLQAYAIWGRDCLKRLNGDFAFVVLDLQERRFFAARDRFSIKPLYLYPSPLGFLAFASEIKQFTGLPGWSARANAQMVYDFLRWGKCDHTEDTLFSRVQQLPGGHYCEGGWDGRWSGPRNWYNPSPGRFSGSAVEAEEEFRSLFFDSVALRTSEEVPLGATLSGGLDSTSVCFGVREKFPEVPLKTFSVRSPYPEFDEGIYIQEAVRVGGFSNFQVLPTCHGSLAELGSLIWHQEEPIAGSSIYAEWCVFRRAQEEGIKVTLDGHGSDEYLAGYSSFLGPFLLGCLRAQGLAALLKEALALVRGSGIGASTLLVQFVRQALSEPLLSRLRQSLGRRAEEPFDWVEVGRLGANPILSAYLGDRDRDVAAHSWSCLFKGGIATQLHWADRSSMAFSVESRAPFLDHRLVEFGLSLPEQMLLGQGNTKKILRQAMAGFLPERVAQRKRKLGYVTGEEHWVRRESPDLLYAAAVRAIRQCKGIANAKSQKVFHELIYGSRPYNPHYLWPLITLGEWMERFSVELDGDLEEGAFGEME